MSNNYIVGKLSGERVFSIYFWSFRTFLQRIFCVMASHAACPELAIRTNFKNVVQQKSSCNTSEPDRQKILYCLVVLYHRGPCIPSSRLH